MKNIVLYVLLFLSLENLLANDVYKSVQEVVHREVPAQDVDDDGILDYLDDCPDSYVNTKVNKKGCPATAFIVLLPNAKKHNAILVENGMGSVDVREAYTYVKMGSADEEPSEPQKISKSEVDAMFPFIANNRYKKATSYTLYFRDTKLTKSSKNKIRKIFKDIRARNHPFISIVGHTDTVSSKKKNFILGEKRAEKVKKLIDEASLEYIQINLTSRGETDLKIKTKDEVNEPRNRRVEISIK